VVEHAARLPIGLRFKNGISKYLLKQLAERLLPQTLSTEKTGVGVPLEYWFKKNSRNMSAVFY
jgi:hypothetical protein